MPEITIPSQADGIADGLGLTITPDMSGSVHGADDTVAILRARDRALATGSALVFPRGIYSLNQPLEIKQDGVSVVIMPGATLKATDGFVGDALINVGDPTIEAVFGVFIGGGGTLDANGKANIGVDVLHAKYSGVRDLVIKNAPLKGIHIGSPSAISTSYQVTVDGIELINVRGAQNGAGSIAVHHDNASDCHVARVDAVGYRKGFRSDGGTIDYHMCHPWVHSDHGVMTHGFDIWGSNNSLSQCYADTPTNYADPAITGLYGFYLHGINPKLNACSAFMNTGLTNDISTDNLVFPIYADQNVYGVILGFTTRGATSIRRWKDVLGGGFASTTLRIGMEDEGAAAFAATTGRGNHIPSTQALSFGGAVSALNDMTVFNALRIRGSAGFNRDFVYQTGPNLRWVNRVDSVAEGGSNAGSNWNLMGYSDAGGFLGTWLSVERATGKSAFGAPIKPGEFTKAVLLTKPATAHVSHISAITDPAAGKGRLVISDGTNWRYVSDDSIVS